MNNGLEIVGFLFNNEEYCRQCFEKVGNGHRIRFKPLYRAVVVQSSYQTCSRCKKNLLTIVDVLRSGSHE